MKVLKYRDDKNWMSSHVHMLITRFVDYNTEDLIAVGLIDADTSARAVAARIVKGEKTDLYRDSKAWSSEKRLLSKRYMYRLISRPIDKLNHTIVIHKSAVDDRLLEGQSRILIIPDGGNIEDLFLQRFSTDFNLPYVPEWKSELWSECKNQGYIGELKVWVDEEVPFWQDVKAFEMKESLTEDAAKDVLSSLLASNRILLPEGVTDAPQLSEALVPNEEGQVKVIDYLQTYAPHLAVAIEDLATPAHDLDRPIDPEIAKMGRIPFPAQAHTIQAIVNVMQEQKGVICSSDMGTGKSITALGVANSLAKKSNNGFACLMLVPGITIPKWIRDEIGKTLPGVKVTVLEDWHSAVRYREQTVRNNKKAPIEFVLLSRDTAKLGMPKVPALQYHEQVVFAEKVFDAEFQKEHPKHDGYITKSAHLIKDVFTCPDCGAIQIKQTKAAEKAARAAETEADKIKELKLGFDDLATRMNGKQIMWRDSVTECHCTACGHNLMRFVVPERENVKQLKRRRLQPAWFLKKYVRNHFDLLVVDELHQYKSNSGQGEAMGALVGTANKVLGLTGTLSDGKASSLYHLLWRLAPQQMKQEGFDHKACNKFVSLYGTLETKTRFSKDDVIAAGGSTNRKVIKNPPREIPGLSPKLFVNYLADKCTFLELGDLGLPLVELTEQPIFHEMEDDHRSTYNMFHGQLEGAMKQEYAKGNTGAFAKFIPSVVNAANQPHKDMHVAIGDDLVSFYAPNDSSQRSAKETALIKQVQSELEQGRRCVVYVRYSGDAEQDRRIFNILKEEGIRVKTLEATVSPEDRVEWLEDVVEKNVQVVVCNAKLVEVGLDLLSFPTLIFFQFTDEVATLRQSSRRSWRIGQHRACKVFYHVYSGSYEMVQFKRFLKKRSHSMLLEGRLDRSDVATFAELDDKSSSTFSIAACLGDVEDLAAKWQSLADKDIPQGVVTLEEQLFKEEIGLAMKRLAAETCRIAGVEMPSEEPVEATPESPTIVALPGRAERVSQDTASQALLLFSDDVLSACKGKASDSSNEPAPLITVGEMRSQMGLVVKAKRKYNVTENQLGFAL
ncbi:DEAD/DEAH box helicase family protein [Alicyclobacillus fodiniaquatilis]|uniref:DEAD/DEAH box helicase family protein n=1 Tax=Alicyclobacillus fodiniaquatilis TaxID=1661150 RepID=A0ABW4JLW1_9BACL